MEEFRRQKKEERRRVKSENREKQKANDNSNNSSGEPVLSNFELRKVPPQDNKKSSLEVIREYGWVAKAPKKISVPSRQNRTLHFSVPNAAIANSPRRSVQFYPSPGSTISDITYSQSSPTRSSPISKKAVKTSLNFQRINFDDDSDDDDILNLVDFLAKEIKTVTPVTNILTSIDHKRDHVDSKNESQNELQVVRPINSEESENDDLVQRSQKVESRRKRVRTSHKPLALHQKIEESITHLSKIEGMPVVSQLVRNKMDTGNRFLWDDSDQEASPSSDLLHLPGTPSSKEKKYWNQTKDLPRKSKANPTPPRSGTKNRAPHPSRQDPDCSEEVILENERRPEFQNPKLGPPSALVPLILDHYEGEHYVPASINRYLKDYQRAGIRFIHGRIVEGKGCILGDDMGLGKTIQVIALLAGMLGKSGTGRDLIRLNERRRQLNAEMVLSRAEQNSALSSGILSLTPLFKPKWPDNLPVLVIVPSSVTQNWINEFNTWGYFGVALYHGGDRSLSLERVRTGLEEVLVCSKGVLVNGEDLDSLKAIPWKLIVVDEQHQQKNRKSASFQGLASLRDTCHCPVLGMTGTIMQNNPEELWACVETVEPGFLESWEEFKAQFATPIMMARTKTATDDVVRRGDAIVQILTEKLKILYIKRNKSQVLADDLPMKDERVLFCEPSPIQKELYQHILMLPDFILLKYAQAPCKCGVNRAIFQQFKRLRNEKEKLDFQRRMRDHIQKRWQCCWTLPSNPDYDSATCDPEEICDPMAPLWKWQHKKDSGKICKNCPFCLLFPALNKLLKLSSHPSLLQLDRPPDSYQHLSAAWQSAMKDLDFAKVAIPDNILRQLPGGSYIRQDGIMDQHTVLSGKMKVLAKLLKEFTRRNSRLLLFSHSTQMLDLIQNFVRSEGYSFLRLDGSTPNKNRQALVDQYQGDDNIFLFLISTKAGGLGLNLTAANVVIIFDVDFNPSNDEQAQDRAFRIGQQRDVLVIRLVTRGTIEELKYIRQIYKVQLKQDTIGDVEEGERKKAARMFRAVQGDKDRKGELFGIENLLRYKDGSFMDDLWKSNTSEHDSTIKKAPGLESRLGLVSAENVAIGIQGMDEEAIDDIGRNPDEWIEAPLGKQFSSADPHDDDDIETMLANGAVSHADYLHKDKGHAALEEGDDGFDVEQGGYSQVVNDVMEYADVDLMESDVSLCDTDCVASNHPSPVMSSVLPRFDDACSTEPAIDLRSHVTLRDDRTLHVSTFARPITTKRQRVNTQIGFIIPSTNVAQTDLIDVHDELGDVASSYILNGTSKIAVQTVISRIEPVSVPVLTQQSLMPVGQALASSVDCEKEMNVQRRMTEFELALNKEAKNMHDPKKNGSRSDPTKVSSGGKKTPASKQRTTFSSGDLFLPGYTKKKKKSSGH